MPIKIGPYQISGHRPGAPLKEGDSGFVHFPVKIENTTARAPRANRVDLKEKGPASGVTLDQRDVAQQPPIVQKAVISVRKAPSKLDGPQNFSVRHVEGERFLVSTFIPRAHGLSEETFKGEDLDVSELKENQPELFAAMELNEPEKKTKFQNELAKFVLDARDLFRNPKDVSEALQPLNQELGRKLGWEERDYHGVDTLVIGEAAVMLPNYANIQPLGQKKNNALSTVLQEHEALHGVNIDGKVVLFDGFIDPKVANPFIADGHLFGENENRANFMIHGTYSHRLQWECIRQWIESGKLRVPAALRQQAGDDSAPNTYSHKNLLAVAVYVTTASKDASLWGKLFDSADDARRHMDGEVSHFRVDPVENGMSCLAPNLMMTNLKCFGDALDLKHLQKYLNDSAVKRLRKHDVIDRSDVHLKMESNPKIRERKIFNRLALLLNTLRQPSFDDVPFTLPDASQEGKMYAALKPRRRAAAHAFVNEQKAKYDERGPR